MAKRGNNEGSITKRPDGRWEARIMLEGGRRKSFYAKTRQAAAQKLAAALRDRDRGLPIVGEQQTVAQYLAGWLETARTTVRPRTWKRYAEYVNLHIVPALGTIRLSKLTPQQVQLFYAKKLAEGLSPTTVAHAHAVLHHALDAATRLGVVQRNVAALVDPPRVVRHEMATLTPEQARAFLEEAKGDRFEALYVFALTTGMRQGELLALRWREVDLDRGTLQVRGTLQRTSVGLEVAEPKTARSRRRVALTVTAVEALKRHRLQQLQERIALGEVWDDHDLVFPNSIGRPMEATNLLRNSFFPLLRRAGLPRIRFHDLRHTAATLLLSRGVHPKVVAELLGHATISVTLDTYSHVLPDMQREATAAMDAVLGG